MIQLSNLNKVLLSTPLIFFSCENDNINNVSCPPNQMLDSCGQCYNSDNDDGWNSCLDECNVQYGENICDLNGVLGGDCECAGCPEFGDPAYCEDCLVSDLCSCNYDQLLSMFHVNINHDCSDLNNCNSYSFDNNNLTFKIRQRCGILLNINADYILQSLNEIQFNDPCGEAINIEYFDDEGINADLNNGCDLPINTIYINVNGDVLYNSSDDIHEFEFSIYNQCENVPDGVCAATDGCIFTEYGCILDVDYNIGGGDAQNSNFDMTSYFDGANYFIFGEKCDESLLPDCEVIPDNSDYINQILFYNNDTVNSIYLKWPDIISDTDYITIDPSEVFIIAHNNWCDASLGSLLINNDNLTIFQSSTIEGYFNNNDEYVKFGDLEIDLNFHSLIEFEDDRPEYCP